MSRTKVSQETPQPNGQGAVIGSLDSAPSTKTTGINWDQMRLPQNFGDHLKTRRIAVSVAVQKPDRQSWVYIQPEPEWRCIMGLVIDKVNRRSYVVNPDIQPEIADDVVPKLLVTYATRQGSFGLWPIRVPDENGRLDSYNESALAIVNMYAGQWVRVLLDQSQGAYYILDTTDTNLTIPKWPEYGLTGLLDLAFRGRVISSLEHPAVLALRKAAEL